MGHSFSGCAPCNFINYIFDFSFTLGYMYMYNVHGLHYNYHVLLAIRALVDLSKKARSIERRSMMSCHHLLEQWVWDIDFLEVLHVISLITSLTFPFSLGYI